MTRRTVGAHLFNYWLGESLAHVALRSAGGLGVGEVGLVGCSETMRLIG